MKNILLFFSTVLVFACGSSGNKNSKIDGPVYKEIAARIKLLNQDSVQLDSLHFNPNEIDSNVNALILLSKDIENISASVNRSNSYFDGLAAKYKLSSYDFLKLKNGMHVDDIATTLKQNELSFFNIMLLKNNKSDLLLHTAH